MRLVLLLFLSSIILFSCNQQESKTVPIYEQKISDTVRSSIAQGNKVRKIGNYEQAVTFYRQAIQLAKQQDDDAGLIEAYRNYIFVNGAILNKKDTAIAMANEAIDFAHELGDANSLCDMYGLKAVTYQAAGILDSAIVFNKIALKYMDEDTAPFKQKNWPLYLNVAELYSSFGNQKLAIEYTNRYLNEYVLPIKDTSRMITTYGNLSLYYTELNDSIGAYSNVYKAYHLLLKRPDIEKEDGVYSNMFAMYNNRKMYDSAYYFAEKYQKAISKADDKVGDIRAIKYKMEIAEQSSNKELASRLLKEYHVDAVLSYEEVPLRDRKNILEQAYKLSKMLGNDKEAYYYLGLTYNLGVELRRQEINKDMEQYELQRKKVMQENVLLGKELQLKNKNNTILGLIIGSLCVFIIGAGILLWYKRRATLHKKQIELLEKEKEWNRTKSMLEGQLEERNRISRELHDDLGASLTSIALAGEIMKNKNTDIKEDLQLITTSANNMVDTLNEIVWSLNSRNDSLLGLIAYIRKFAVAFLGKKNIKVFITDNMPTEDETVSSTIRRQVYLSAKEAINNIVKHSHADNVTIVFELIDGVLNIKIKDDGNGLQHKSTNKGGGNGLLNMKKNMELINGKCTIYNDNGTVVNISCKVDNFKEQS